MRIQIENTAPGGPVKKFVVGDIVYDVVSCKPESGGMIEVYRTNTGQVPPPSQRDIKAIRTRDAFARHFYGAGWPDAAISGDADRQAMLVAFDKVIQVVNDWCVEYNNEGGIDAGDLAWRLEAAGYALPPDDDE
jgi:hypothetical protein